MQLSLPIDRVIFTVNKGIMNVFKHYLSVMVHVVIARTSCCASVLTIFAVFSIELALTCSYVIGPQYGQLLHFNYK